MRRLLVLVTIVLTIFLSFPTGLLAQDGSPVASPPAVACAATPRSAEEVLSLWYEPNGSPVATSIEPNPAASPAALPAGDSADLETVAAINTTVQAWATCYNAGDVLGTLGLLSDDLVRRQGPQAGATRGETSAALAALSLPPAEPLIVSEAGDARVLNDGRVAAIFVFGDPQLPAATVFIVFVDVDGRWLLDDIQTAPTASELSAAATPAA
jgi:hypothetical protein